MTGTGVLSVLTPEPLRNGGLEGWGSWMIGVADGAARARCVTQHDSRGLAAAENTEKFTHTPSVSWCGKGTAVRCGCYLCSGGTISGNPLAPPLLSDLNHQCMAGNFDPQLQLPCSPMRCWFAVCPRRRRSSRTAVRFFRVCNCCCPPCCWLCRLRRESSGLQPRREIGESAFQAKHHFRSATVLKGNPEDSHLKQEQFHDGWAPSTACLGPFFPVEGGRCGCTWASMS